MIGLLDKPYWTCLHDDRYFFSVIQTNEEKIETSHSNCKGRIDGRKLTFVT